jgi:hypothetical protein
MGVTSVAGAGKTLHFILSQTSAGKRHLTRSLLIGLSCREAVPWACTCAGHYAQRPSRLTGTVAFVPAPAVCRPWRSRARCHPGWGPAIALLVENRPGDTGELIGERDCEQVVVRPLSHGFARRLAAVARPTLRPDDRHPGRLHEPRAQGGDCRASICCRGWYGLRSRSAGGSNPSQAAKSRPLENPGPAPMGATARQSARTGLVRRKRALRRTAIPVPPQAQSDRAALPARSRTRCRACVGRVGTNTPDHRMSGQSRFAWSAVDETARLTLMNSSAAGLGSGVGPACFHAIGGSGRGCKVVGGT